MRVSVGTWGAPPLRPPCAPAVKRKWELFTYGCYADPFTDKELEAPFLCPGGRPLSLTQPGPFLPQSGLPAKPLIRQRREHLRLNE